MKLTKEQLKEIIKEEFALQELGPNTTKTDFPAGASSEHAPALDRLYEDLQSYAARYGRNLPEPRLMKLALDSITNLKARLKRLEESLY